MKANHDAFIEMLMGLSDDDFELTPNGKWSAGQQLDHIVRSVKPLVNALRLPNFGLKIIVGKANRPSRSYDELISKYQSKLAEGGQATGSFVPKPVVLRQKEGLITTLENLVRKLCRQIDGYSEEQMDHLILPHPLLGKLTLREMMYFTFYHVKHHHTITLENLQLEEISGDSKS